MQSRTAHVYRIDVEHLLGAKVGPHPLQPGHRTAPLMGFRGQHTRGDCARRSAHDDVEWVACPGQQFRESAEHADLISRARSAAGQDEPDRRPGGSVGLKGSVAHGFSADYAIGSCIRDVTRVARVPRVIRDEA